MGLRLPILTGCVCTSLFPRAAGILVCLFLFAFSAAAWQEAPMLAQKVSRGELPPVEERLPEEPVVITPVSETGVYGGDWRRIAVNPLDMSLTSRLGYEAFVQWDRSGKKAVPGVMQSWKMEDEGRTFIFHLRKGLRWSDGAPFTSADILFCFNDVFGNQDLFPVYPDWMVVGGERGKVTAPDTWTVRFEFASPYGLFLENLAFRTIQCWFPKHYLQRFHIAFNEAEKLREMAHDENFDYWFQLFHQKANQLDNPDCPTIRPFQLHTGPPATRWLAVRNPYYWKVDPEGNQLPYIDRITFAVVQNGEILNFKAMAGEVDFQARHIDAANFPLFMENRKKGGYRVMTDPASGPVVIYLNQHSHDPVMRQLLCDRRFRIALSVAIDRAELIDLIYTGMAQPARGVAGPFDPYYLPEFEEKYIEYNPDQARRLLDEIGLPAGDDGMRCLPDGKPFRKIMHVFPSEAGNNADLWQLVADYWREAGLDFVVKIDNFSLSQLQVRNGNSDFWAYATAGMHWVLDPMWYVPWNSTSYFAPLYGQYQASGGRSGIKPPPEYQRLIDWYLELRATIDPDRKMKLGRNILRQWAEECYTIGIVRQDLVTLVSNRFHNVPEQLIHSYRVLTPGYIGIEQFYIAEEE
jgi:peptide/nickel transport system substrate-binding protein